MGKPPTDNCSPTWNGTAPAGSATLGHDAAGAAAQAALASARAAASAHARPAMRAEPAGGFHQHDGGVDERLQRSERRARIDQRAVDMADDGVGVDRGPGVRHEVHVTAEDQVDRLQAVVAVSRTVQRRGHIGDGDAHVAAEDAARVQVQRTVVAERRAVRRAREAGRAVRAPGRAEADADVVVEAADQRIVQRVAPEQVLVGCEVARHVVGLDRRRRIAEEPAPHLAGELVVRLPAGRGVVADGRVEGDVAGGHFGRMHHVLVFRDHRQQQQNGHEDQREAEEFDERLAARGALADGSGVHWRRPDVIV
jgi:hypothetical protein